MIDKIEIVNDRSKMRLFHGCIETTEKREKEPIFQPNLSIETNPKERESIEISE